MVQGSRLNVGHCVWSLQIRWDPMSNTPPGSDLPASTHRRLPGGRRTVWTVVGGWTLFGLFSFASSVLVTSRQGYPSTGVLSRLGFSLGTAWTWAALTLLALKLTAGAVLAPGKWIKSAIILGVAAVGFVLVSMGLELVLAGARGRVIGHHLLHERFETSLLACLVFIALSQAANFFVLSRSRQLRNSELEASLAKIRIQTLERQLQPHFLLNTLNTVAELVHTEPDAADKMITGLGRLLRLSLDNAGQMVGRLRDECDFLRLYIEIEQLRFQNRLEVVWQLAPATMDAAVPTLLWHPVLENAILHGLAPTGRSSRLVIAARREGDDLVLEIRDNGRGLPEGGVQREGVGLRSIRERAAQLYGSRARFSLEPAPGGGTIAALRLPFIPYNEFQAATPATDKAAAGDMG